MEIEWEITGLLWKDLEHYIYLFFFFFEKKYISVLSLHYTARLLGDFGPDESMGPLIGGFIFDCWIQVPSVVNQPFG